MTVNLPPLPAGYTTRHASIEDVEMAAQAGCEYALATTGYQDVSPETLRHQWLISGFKPETDVYFIFSPQSKLVGYSEVWAINQPPIHPWVWGMVDIQHQGLGLGTHMLAWVEQRLAQVVENVPAGLRFAPRAGTDSTIRSAQELLENNGWKHIRSAYTMRIDLDSVPFTPQFPSHLTIRTFRLEDIEPLYRADRDAFRDHFGYIEQPYETGLARYKQAMLDDPHFDANLWYLAWDGDELAGFCLCHKHADDDPEAGYVADLGVRRAWRKQGLGLAFLQHAFGEFQRRGYPRVTLHVDAENLTGALRLYEKAGMHIHRQSKSYEKEIRPGREISTQTL